MKALLIFSYVILAAALLGCENPVKRAVRDVKYSGYEMIGVQKRDLLKRHLNETSEDQTRAAETFEDALEKLRKLYGLKSSELERQYKSVKSAYDDSQSRAEDVRSSRKRMQSVAEDLFREWEDETDQIENSEMRSSSRQKLKASRAQFTELDRSLGEAEKKMDPVLGRLRDHVLYLKHNLNAESLSSLKGERDRINGEIEVLIKDMHRATVKANEYIKTLP